MWLDVLFQETLMREQISEAQRYAARRMLVHQAEPPRAPRRTWPALRRLTRALRLPRLKRLVERMVLP